jgi:hypothetical protein
MTPDTFHCEHLAKWAASLPIRDALARIRFNDKPFTNAEWIAALEAEIADKPGSTGQYTTLIARIKAMQGAVQ